MNTLIPWLAVAAALLWLGAFLLRRARTRRAFAQVLADHGFRPVPESSPARIDFSITLQWPEQRGITYLDHYAKEDKGATIRVANVLCWEAPGARPNYPGAGMRVDEIRQTVVSCILPGHSLPRFCLFPRYCAEMFSSLVERGTEIRTGDAGFDRHFYVVGASSTDTTRILTDPVRAAMLAQPELMLASGRESVLVFRQGAVLAPSELCECLVLVDTIRQGIGASSSTLGTLPPVTAPMVGLVKGQIMSEDGDRRDLHEEHP